MLYLFNYHHVTSLVRLIFSLLAVVGTCLLTACDRRAQVDEGAAVTVLRVWAHAGQVTERDTLRAQVGRFNAAYRDIRLELSFLPERTYNAQVQAAALAGDLPDILELDGPYLYNYIWQGQVQALDGLVAAEQRKELLPSILDQGSYGGKLFGIGSFDSGLGLYARRSALRRVGARIPRHPDEAWTLAEFEALLAALAAKDADGAVLDLKLNYPDEWFSYAFGPVLRSAGGDLIDRSSYRSAAGVLNGVAAVRAMGHIQHWLKAGWVDPNVDDNAFVGGRVALSWAGHWEYRRYQATVGDDLVLLPLPDFGQGSRTAQGSWLWTLSRRCRRPQQAIRFIHFLLQTREVLAMTAANGAVPATHSAIAQSVWYRQGGPLHLFVEQLNEGFAVPRPKTPAYPVISSAFRQAFAAVRDGAPVQAALDRAVAVIDQDLRDNQAYQTR